MAGSIHSMTGFGSAEVKRDGGLARVEIRTVNHRHLQVKVRLPIAHSPLEPQVEAVLKKSLARGSVQVQISLETGAAATSVTLDHKLAKAYLKELESLGKAIKVEGSLTLAQIATLPGIFSSTEESSDLAKEAKWIMATVKAALVDLKSMRETEGAAMVKDLRVWAKAIEKQRKLIATRSPKAVTEHAAKLRQRVQNLLGDSQSISPKDVAREVALLADRLDVSEELARLQAHLEQLDSLLVKGGAVGRKLDFLAQEFMREANTIGSKCSDAKTAHYVVELKACIERMREQVQNVE
ncbi:MAG: YicC family protein [Planctomycetes bacterium]|nr:YicC family protein [Planctomycetota bacterium]